MQLMQWIFYSTETPLTETVDSMLCGWALTPPRCTSR